MFDGILAFLQSLPHELYVFIISILPLIELRGAVPIGAAIGLPFYTNYLVSVIGNILPVPFILLFIPKILDFLAKFKTFRPMVEWLHKKAEKNRGKIVKSEELRAQSAECDEERAECEAENAGGRVRMSAGIFAALMLFVAIPLPGTGAWTGALAASLFDFPKRGAFFAILLGVMICGVIMCLASYGILGFLSFLL